MDGSWIARRLGVRIAASTWFLAAPLAQAQSAGPASLQWSNPTTLPLGALAAVASGDPASPGRSTFLLSMPDGYRVPPYFHPGYEHLEVRQGTLLVGTGDDAQPELARPLAAGDSITLPEGMPISGLRGDRGPSSL
jgi:hypothetical protein